MFALLLASGYGILHDQLTYTLSEEYYTKFKFIQFQIIEEGNTQVVHNSRLWVAVVSFLATWWIGIPIGLFLGAIGFIQKNERAMLAITSKAYLITLGIAIVTGLAGLIYGKFYLSKTAAIGWLSENIIDKENFLSVGAMHTFSYIGGFIGLLIGISYSVWKAEKSPGLNGFKISSRRS